MKMYVFSSGKLWAEKAFLWHFGPAEDAGKEYESQAFCVQVIYYFIDHPEAKILFDTGFTIEDYEKKRGFALRKSVDSLWMKQEPDENPVAQLGKIGLKIDDIDYVVMSHLMSEHAGWLPTFAGKKAQIVVQYKEYGYARRIGMPNIPGEPPPVEQFHTWMYRRHQFEVPGLNYKLIDGDYELVSDVWMLHVPGHTPGYQVMYVKLPKTGPVVLSSCEHRGNYYGIPIHGTGPGIPHTFTWSAADELRMFKRIRELVEREKGQIFCGHDLEQFKTLKHVPEYYE